LLKKYKKWTGSTNLEVRFRDEVLDDPKGFTKLDLGPMLDQYSETLQDIRSLYEDRIKQTAGYKGQKVASPTPRPSVIDQLHDGLRNSSRVEFDTAIATVPLGVDGEIANYFVHPENVVELQVLLLQYLRYYTSRSRSSSTATPLAPSTPTAFSGSAARDPDYFIPVADNRERFAQEQSAVTVNQREHTPGRPPQMAKAFVRWNNSEDAILTARTESAKTKSVSFKRKHLDSLFARDTPLPKKEEVRDCDELVIIRNQLLKDANVHPLYKLSSSRSRFASINDGPNSLSLATLDTSISMQGVNQATKNDEPSDFPFAVLQVRKEGPNATNLLSTLESSHLVERVRGFSLQYHALWQTCKPKNISPPFWIPMLSQDIRKLPPPAMKRNGSLVESGSGSRSAAHGSNSTGSTVGFTDSTTAVETSRPASSLLPEQLSAPPLRSFRKKRRRTYAERIEQQQRYWSEYNDPEDVEQDADAYVIYIDPNEKSTLDQLFDKIGGLFGQREPEEEALLHPTATPDDDDTSDDEAEHTNPPSMSYGTLSRSLRDHRSAWPGQEHPFLPQITSICFFASISILVVAYILATTSKHKYAAEVDVGIIFAIACSLAFSIIGFITMLRRTEGTWVSFGVAVGVLVTDAICSGFLLAWVLG
jgi:heme/copper-type cytochrome/quinol oxidase subunit 4